MKALLLAWLCAVPAILPVSASAALPAAASAAQAGGGNIAILDFKPNNASAGDAATVTDFVRSAFVKSGAWAVVDKGNMERILAEQAFQQTGCTDSGCAVRLGKLLNVRKMVVGKYSVMGSVRFLTASLVDVETGRIEGTAKVKGFEVGNADEAADDLVRQLSGGAASVEADEARRGEETALRAAEEEKARLEAGRKAAEAAARETARREGEKLKRERQAEADRRRTELNAARVARGRIGVGLNFPGLGLRALVGNRWMIEGWGQYEKEAQAYGGRLYLYVFPGSRVYPYLGAGGGYARYQGGGFDTPGYLGEAFAGLEYFIWKRLSLQGDGGATYVGLKEGAVAIDGVRFTVNFGLTVYF